MWSRSIRSMWRGRGEQLPTSQGLLQPFSPPNGKVASSTAHVEVLLERHAAPPPRDGTHDGLSFLFGIDRRAFCSLDFLRRGVLNGLVREREFLLLRLVLLLVLLQQRVVRCRAPGHGAFGAHGV